MAAIKKNASKTDKKKSEQDILQKLETALGNYKDVLGEKKFKNRIKKAAKLFLKGTPKRPQVKKAAPAPKKKAPGKAVKKSIPAKK